jgi:hypothetical protein
MMAPEEEVGWLVCTRDATAGRRYGLRQSKKAVWWQLVWTEEDAAARQQRIGPGAWVAPISQMRQKPRQRYAQPAQTAIAAREAERLRALADFEAGRDWPPWGDEPIEDGRI